MTRTVAAPVEEVGPLVRLERRGPVTLLGLHRPGKYNALDEAMVDDIDRALLELRHEPTILVVHSTTPGVFAAGADIAELIDRDADAALRGINAGLFDRIERHRWPTIAVVDGAAFGGGCELALACDLRVGSPRARFGQPELGLGILAGAGANWRLPQAVGLPMARRMLYAGEVLDADSALVAGLLDAVHPAEGLLDRAVELAESIASRSWRALELTKLALASHRPATTSLDIVAQAVLFDREEKRERMGRFLDERAARRAARTSTRGPGRLPATPIPDPMAPFRVRQLTIEDGLALAGWSTPGAWHIEDALQAPEPDEGYWAVVDAQDTLLGFCCVGMAARVPGQNEDPWALDVAIGIRPQLVGRGWGAELGRAAVAYASSVALDRRLRTTVPDWNAAAQRAAEHSGFRRRDIVTFEHQRYEIFEQTR